MMLVPLLVALLVTHLVSVISGQDCIGQSTFVIQAGREAASRIVSEETVSSLDECLLFCNERIFSCKAVNFKSAQANSTAMCQLLEAGVSDQNLLLKSDRAMYYAEKMCMPTLQNFCEVSWAFEAIHGVEIAREIFVTMTISHLSVEECLVECLKKREQCHSTFFNEKSGECRLVQINRHTVRYFDENFLMGDGGWTMYENNCINAHSPDQKCQFFNSKSEGMSVMFDSRISDVPSPKDCQEKCMELAGTTCRSYTYNWTEKSCYLSHSSMRNLIAISEDRKAMRKRLKTKDMSVEMGDLEDCYHFELKCKHDGMMIKGDSMRLFNGDIMAKNDESCKTILSDSYTFETEVPYKKCGTKKSASGTYTNVIFLKDGSTPLITVRDKLIQVICRIYDGQDIQVSYRLNIQGNDTEETIEKHQALILPPSTPLVTKPRQKFKLNVLDNDKKPAAHVKIGETGYLEISYDESDSNELEDQSGIEVTDLYASDISENVQVQLYDHNGCPVSPDASALEVEDGKVQAKIKFSGFQNVSKIFYKGLVKLCKGNCKPLCKSKKGKIENLGMRLKRSKSQFYSLSSEDAMILSEIQYAVSTGSISLDNYTESHIGKGFVVDKTRPVPKFDPNRPIRLPQLLDLLSTEMTPGGNEQDEHTVMIESAPNTLTMCVHSLTCVVTVMLASLQAVLLVLCFSIGYFYFKRYRWRRRMTPSLLALGNSRQCGIQFVVETQTANGTYRDMKQEIGGKMT